MDVIEIAQEASNIFASLPINTLDRISKETVPSFESEVGEAPQAFANLAKCANELENQFNTLVHETSSLLKNAAEAYKQEDENLAQSFQ